MNPSPEKAPKPNEGPARLAHEKQTVTAMVRIYCRAHHGSDHSLCESCEALLAYALERLDRCPFGEAKPVCAQCEIHCYKPQMRERIREVMRFAGPRMPLVHPVLAVRHLLRTRKRQE